MSLAILCSGQGPQHPGMFALTGTVTVAADLFAHASTLLGGRDPLKLVHSETNDALHDNRTGQILCALQSLAAAVVLKNLRAGGLIVAGYSVGEVAAWGVADLIAPKTVLDLTARRAEVMDAASTAGDGLLFVRGLSRGVIDYLCERHDIAVAIVNPGDAFALGGGCDALDAVAKDAEQRGAERVVRIGVKVASHTQKLIKASAAFRECLNGTAVAPNLSAGVRLFSGIDAAPVLDIQTGLNKLADQISHTIQWSDCLAGCMEAGASAFFELGPGRALVDMVTAVHPQIPARSLEDFRTVEGVHAWLSRTTA